MYENMTPSTTKRRVLLPALVIGFGTAVAMWLIGFCSHFPGFRAPAPSTAVLLILAQLAGGFIAARLAHVGVLTTFLGGLITALINLLIVGSVVASDESANALRPGWPVVIAGTLAFGGVCGALGGWAGRRLRAKALRHVASAGTELSSVWLSCFALVAVGSALPVLLSGGLVTSTGTGLAVPDWPTSYNANMFLYPLSKMTGGIYYEHAHRLFGSLVGLTTLVLTVLVFAVEKRGWVKGLAVFAFLFVCGQGVLGGIRVTTADTVSSTLSPETLADNRGSLALAMVHGITAQLFFGLLCAFAAIVSMRWKALIDDDAAPSADRGLRTMAMLLVGALFIQLSMGSAARHMHQSHALWTHVGFSVIVIVLASATGFRAAGRFKQFPPIRLLGKMLSHAVGLQTVLGLITLFLVLPYEPGKTDPPLTVAMATTHQAIGAVLMGSACAMLAWSCRVAARGVGARTGMASTTSPA